MNEFPGFGSFGRRVSGEPPVIDPEATQAMALLKKVFRRWATVVGILVIVLFMWNQCVVITLPHEFNVIMQFGEIRRVAAESGLSFKIPFIQSVRVLPKTIQLYDIPISDVITQDKKTMEVDSFILWKISDPTMFIRQLSGNIVSAEIRVGNNTYNSMKNVISMLPQTDIISGRDVLAARIVDNLGGTLTQYGITLVGIETKHLDLPEENKQAVYTRMISERNNIAASYLAEGDEEAQKIRSETDKTVSIMLSEARAEAAKTIADGERRYMEILADAYGTPEKAEFYSFIRALDAAKVSLRNGDTILILSADSPIAQIFYRID